MRSPSRKNTIAAASRSRVNSLPSDPSGQPMSVVAAGSIVIDEPSSVYAPRIELQSAWPEYVPSSANAIVYFDGSSGVALVSFEYWLPCHSQVTPVRPSSPSPPPASPGSPPPQAATERTTSSTRSESGRRMARAY